MSTLADRSELIELIRSYERADRLNQQDHDLPAEYSVPGGAGTGPRGCGLECQRGSEPVPPFAPRSCRAYAYACVGERS
jgi:hypothetical protein